MSTDNSFTPVIKSKAMDMVQSAYNQLLRERLPRKWTVYGSIPARDGRLLDFKDHISPYKPGLRDAINDVVDGDDVTLVGGGRGVSSVWLAKQGATVHAYEAAEEMVDIAQQTVALQGYSNDVVFHHALVGEAVDVFGSAANADVVPPRELDTRDVLVMDCEGAEKSILSALDKLPETIIVETHPECGVPTPVTRALLNGRGYDVSEREYLPDKPDKRVLVGER